MSQAPRKIAVIVALDVAGYSVRTEADEAKTTAEADLGLIRAEPIGGPCVEVAKVALRSVREANMSGLRSAGHFRRRAASARAARVKDAKCLRNAPALKTFDLPASTSASATRIAERSAWRRA
jgi:hypothetical protein